MHKSCVICFFWLSHFAITHAPCTRTHAYFCRLVTHQMARTYASGPNKQGSLDFDPLIEAPPWEEKVFGRKGVWEERMSRLTFSKWNGVVPKRWIKRITNQITCLKDKWPMWLWKHISPALFVEPVPKAFGSVFCVHVISLLHKVFQVLPK